MRLPVPPGRCAFVCALVLGVVYAQPAVAQDDVTPPALETLSFPSTVDVTSGPVAVPLTARITDAPSGLAFAYIQFRSPSGLPLNSDTFEEGTLQSGTINDGEHLASLHVPEFAESGTWTILFVFLKDRANNATTLSTADLASRGLPTSIDVTSVTDVEAPRLEGLSFTPDAVDVTQGAAVVSINAHISDSPAGLAFGYVQLRGPSGQSIISDTLEAGTLQSGTIYDGHHLVTLTVPQFAEGGTWDVLWVFLKDRAGVGIALSAADLNARGLPSSIQVTSITDAEPPVLQSLSFSPHIVDVSNGPAVVQIAARITDAPAGLAFGYVQFRGPSGQVLISDSFYEGTLQSGTINDGQYLVGVTVPQFAERGTWVVMLIFLKDRAGVGSTLYAPDLDARGFPSAISVGLTLAEQIERLTDDLDDLELAPGLVNSLMAKLDAARRALDDENSGPARSQLVAFINQVQGLVESGRLDAATAASLIAAAQAIIDDIDGA